MPSSETIGHGKPLDSQDSRSPLAGEGCSESQHKEWVRGVGLAITPHPSEFVCCAFMPSPARGEGALTTAAALGSLVATCYSAAAREPRPWAETRYSIAACTPPFLCGTPVSASPISVAASAPIRWVSLMSPR